MRIIIISDTHGDIISPKSILFKEGFADYYLHAGDSCSNKEDLLPFVAVRGNCDNFYSNQFEQIIEIETPIGKLIMRHYPFTNGEIIDLKEKGYKIFVHGHTHICRNDRIEECFVLCPGSLTFPRDSKSGTYLVLDINEGAISMNFKNI